MPGGIMPRRGAKLQTMKEVHALINGNIPDFVFLSIKNYFIFFFTYVDCFSILPPK
jgi:hypothetical protein